MDTETREDHLTPGSPQPDIMNDPAFDPTSKGKERNAEEQDTCRICRGEGSSTEPLFYPCRCSGSIKFVHQECLMGWLSHSQKKHCELCKTPFRFTKLYHPQMPTTVPFLVFLKRASLHCLGSVMTFARWILVLSVWLGWVPWCMRIVWRGLFWIGDGGWISPQEIERRTALQAQELALRQLTSPASTGLSSPTSPASSALSIALGNIMWNPFNITFKRADEPVILRMAKSLWRIALFPTPKRAETGSLPTSIQVTRRPGSLLSDYPLVNNLTRSATVNNLAIDVLEGQLIALLVVVGFILVFLIREWVVQQQPAINAGQAVEEANVADQLQEPQETEIEDVPQHVFEHDEDEDPQNLPSASSNQPASIDAGTQPVNQPVQAQAGELGRVSSLRQDTSGSTSLAGLPQSSTDGGRPTPAPGSSRPIMPHRGALSPASEIQRTLEEEALVSGHVWPGVDVFMDLWRRAESDPEEVLRIIREDGKENELAWIVSAMTRLRQGLPLNETEAEGAFRSAIESSSPNPDSANSSWLVVNEDLGAGNAQIENLTRVQEPEAGWQPGVPADNPFVQHRAATLDHVEPATLGGPASASSGHSTADLPYHFGEDIGPPSAHSEAENIAALEPQTETALGAESEPEAGRTWVEAIEHWLWGDIPGVPVRAADIGQDDQHILEDAANEAPFVPVADGQLLLDEGQAEEEPAAEGDAEALRAAAEAGINANDADLDDAEEIEGVLELIGAQGPLIGLLQNGMFCALLIAMAFFTGIWIPYILGKFVLVFMANPVPLLFKLPLRWTSNAADMVVDVLIFLSGWTFYAVDAFVKLTAAPIGWLFPFIKHIGQDNVLGSVAAKHAARSGNRLAKAFVASGDLFSDSDIPVFSIIAHESLVDAQHLFASAAALLRNGSSTLFDGLSSNTTLSDKAFYVLNGTADSSRVFASTFAGMLSKITPQIVRSLRSFPTSISIDIPQRLYPLDYSLAYWSTQDRSIAVLIGYSFVFFVGAVYLKVSSTMRGSNGQRQGDLVDILNQAGGVTKVILIISIEMIVFPLYCGALLDIALLPLFDKATIASRLSFTVEAPMTSTFIHWFIGTCYMFHFALFVAMCRKLMRTGVLYFIRNPDDPTFHPVRDVLEKNVYTQLRKIAFSAIVYGALVLICLGTVVWTISKTTSGIFPIRWASSRMVLEYPIDLLVYNLVMPIAVTFLKPGTVLTAVYRWWFRKCARWLRITHFLFGEKREEEMYRFVEDPFWNLRVTDSTKPENYMAEEQRLLHAQQIASFYPTGHFVRAPASDQVRLPKGSTTFVPVDEHGNRADGKPDSDKGPHGRNNPMFKKIFVPHRFKLRISIFIMMLWLFAAITGTVCTVGPLLFGRMLFAHLLPKDFVVNDVYAFAIGAYILGGPLYLAVSYREPLTAMTRRLSTVHERTAFSLANLSPLVRQTLEIVMRGARLVYFYAGLGLLLPLLLGLLWEMYVIIPMLTFLHPLPAPPYTIRFVQSWTLAVIALRYLVRVTNLQPESRASRALRALVSPSNRNAGWTDPDVRLATRAFVLPVLVLVVLALAIPSGAAAIALSLAKVSDEAQRAVVFRFAYPLALSGATSVLLVRSVGNGLRAWREKVRDEVFLVGERLHNFGESRSSAKNGHDMQRVEVKA